MRRNSIEIIEPAPEEKKEGECIESPVRPSVRNIQINKA